MKRALVLFLLALFLATPVADQLACAFCGPTVETTATAKPVPHTEDDCVLQDGFERNPPFPGEEPIHIHYCLIHATSVALADAHELEFNPEIDKLELSRGQTVDPYLPSFFHPPMAA